MAEERENQDPNPQAEEEPLDQDMLDGMMPDSEAEEGGVEELESLLADLDEVSEEEEPEAEESMDALAEDVDRLVSDSDSHPGEGPPREVDVNDPLFQATLADAEGTRGTSDSEDVAEGEMEDLESLLDDLDSDAVASESEAEAEDTGEEAAEDAEALQEDLDDVGETDESGDSGAEEITAEAEEEGGALDSESEAVAEEAEDLDSLLEGLDAAEDPVEEPEEQTEAPVAAQEVVEAEGAAEEGVDLEASQEDEEAEEVAEPVSESEDVDTLLAGLDDMEEVEEGTEAEATVGEGVGEAEEEGVADTAEEEGAVLEEAEGDAEEAAVEGEAEDLGALLEGLDADEAGEGEQAEEVTAESADEGEAEVEAEAEGEEAAAESAEEVEGEEESEEADDLDAMLEGLDTEEGAESAEDEEVTAESAEEVEGEAESEEADDLDAMLEGLDTEEGAESAEDEEVMAESAEEVEGEEELEEADDLDAMLEGLDTEEGAEQAEDEEVTAESAEEVEGEEESEEADDLDAMLDGLDVEEDAEAAEGGAEELAETGDLDTLLEDLDSEDVSESLEVEETAGEVEGDEEVGADDLDDLLGDLDTVDEEVESAAGEAGGMDELDALLEDDLNVGIEEDVDQILTAGGDAPAEGELEDEDILEDFESVQQGLLRDTGEHVRQATLLIFDDDPDNRALFIDALMEGGVGDYDFVEVENSLEAGDALSSQDVDMVLLNLDLQSDDPFEFLQSVSGPGMPSIYVVVSSSQVDPIEKALRMGARDYFSRPLSDLEREFQVPRKIADLLKLQELERLVAGKGDSPEVPAEPIEDLDEDLLLDDYDEDESVDFEDILLGSESSPTDTGGEGGGVGVAERTRTRGRKRVVPVSDQEKMVKERDIVRGKRRSSRLPLFFGVVALATLLVGVSGFAYKYFVEMKMQELAADRSSPAIKALPVLKPPAVPQVDYQMTRSRRPTDYERQANVTKLRVRQSVQSLARSGGAWWSPWQVLRESGGSVEQVVNGRKVSDVLEAFDVDRSAVEAGLRSQRTLDYLAGVGFDLRGRRAGDLSARETFEVLSAREIKDTEQINEILSSLIDKLAGDRSAQARRKAEEKRLAGKAALDVLRRNSQWAPMGPAQSYLSPRVDDHNPEFNKEVQHLG